MLTFTYEEVLYLLDQIGLTIAFGQSNVDKQTELLQVGKKRLHERGLDKEDSMLQTVTQPTAVLHATRTEDNKSEENIWFFYTPGQIVRMQQANENRYQLTAVSEVTAVLEQIQQFLPLQPAPSNLIYHITVDEEEFENLRDLASEWAEVPSLATLEADGLDLIGAKDLFDSAVAPQWRGIIDFMRVDGKEIVQKQTVRALQEQEMAWLVRPYGPDNRKVLIKTAQAGELQQAVFMGMVRCR